MFLADQTVDVPAKPFFVVSSADHPGTVSFVNEQKVGQENRVTNLSCFWH